MSSFKNKASSNPSKIDKYFARSSSYILIINPLIYWGDSNMIEDYLRMVVTWAEAGIDELTRKAYADILPAINDRTDSIAAYVSNKLHVTPRINGSCRLINGAKN